MQCACGQWSGLTLQSARGLHYHAQRIYTSLAAAAFAQKMGLVLNMSQSVSGVTGIGLIPLRVGRRFAVGLVQAPGGVGGGGI